MGLEDGSGQGCDGTWVIIENFAEGHASSNPRQGDGSTPRVGGSISSLLNVLIER